jgi:gas vesicle protein
MPADRKESHYSGKMVVNILFLMFFSLFFGVFIGLLLAPQTGKKFREAIKYWLNEAVERSKFKMEEAKVYGNEFIDKSKEKVEQFSSKIFSEYDD